MRQRPPSIAPTWIALALLLCIICAVRGIALHVNSPAATASPQHAGEVIRDLAGLHPPGEYPGFQRP